MTTALTRKSEIKQILLEIGELWPSGLHANDEKAVILKRWMSRMESLQNVFVTYTLAHLVIFEMIPLLLTVYNFWTGVREYVLPFQVSGFFKVNSTTSFVISYVWELAGTVPCHICLYVAFDLLVMAIISNMSILFRLLQVDLVNWIEFNSGTQGISISGPASCEKIIRIVKDHQTLLRLSKKLNSIFGLVIFVHVALSAVVICLFGFLTVVFCGTLESIAYLLTVLFSVITIFLLALFGQLLCDASSGVAEAAYQSMWYRTDIKVKKLVLFIIIRSQNTCFLSALGYSNMTLRSVSRIMSTAWTYFSLLVQIYKNK